MGGATGKPRRPRRSWWGGWYRIPVATERERLLVRGMGWAGALFMAWILAPLLFMPFGYRMGHAARLAGMGAALVVMIAMRLSLGRALRRGLRELAAREFLVCPRCRYDLRGAESPCPECGREFEAGGLRAQWDRHYKTHFGSAIKSKEEEVW